MIASWMLLFAGLLQDRFRHARLMPIDWLDAHAPEIELAPGDRVLSVGPRIGGTHHVETVTVPPVRAHVFYDAHVSPISSSVRLGDRIVIERAEPERSDDANFAAGHILSHGRNQAIVSVRPSQRVDQGIFLGGNGAFNYYHWLIEILPKLQFVARIERWRNAPLLISEDVDRTSSFREALNRVAPGWNTVALRRDATCRVDRLLFVTSPARCPFNLRRGHNVRVADFGYREESVRFIRDRLTRGVRGRSSSLGRRIFLARTGSRRRYNQDEILSLCADRGIVPVALEDEDLSTQIRIMSGADVIVGPSGAAWTNLIFCAPGTRGLSWISSEMDQFSTYSTLASLVGVDMRFLTYKTDRSATPELTHQAYHLDTSDFERELDALLAS